MGKWSLILAPANLEGATQGFYTKSWAGIHSTPQVNPSLALPTTDTVMAVAVPRPPAPSVVSAARDEPAPDPEETASWPQLPATAPAWQRRLVAGAQRRRLPTLPLLLVLCFPRFWLGVVAWCVGAHLSARAELGPLYILGTIFILIAINLGQRAVGQASAYSIFNNFRRLPGQLTAEDLDHQLRHGQM